MTVPENRTRYLGGFAFDLLLIGALLVSVVIYHDSLLNIWCVPIGFIIVLHTLVMAYVFSRRRRLGTLTSRAVPIIRISLLTGVMVFSFVFFPRLSLAKEILQYTFNRDDFDQIATLALSLCGGVDADFEIELDPTITAQHGWKTAHIVSDAGGAHFIMLVSRPDPTANYTSVGGTVFIYAQQKQPLGQRLDTPAGPTYCHHYLGGGWYACVVSS